MVDPNKKDRIEYNYGKDVAKLFKRYLKNRGVNFVTKRPFVRVVKDNQTNKVT